MVTTRRMNSLTSSFLCTDDFNVQAHVARYYAYYGIRWTDIAKQNAIPTENGYMELTELKPRKALSKAFLKVKPNRTEIEGFNGQQAASTVGVIIEAKKPTNKSEMPTREKLNSKAFQELVLYYLRERH